MDGIVNFISNNYGWFLTFSIFLLFSLIGYIYDSKRNKNNLNQNSEEQIDQASLDNLNNMEQKGLNDMIGTSKNINPETKQVELTDQNVLNDNQNLQTTSVENTQTEQQ